MSAKKCRWYVGLLVVSLLVLGATPSFAQTTLKYISMAGEIADSHTRLAKDYMRYHPRVKIQVEPVSFGNMLDKAYLDWVVKAGEYDAFCLLDIWLARPIEDGHLQPLEPYFDPNTLAWEDYYKVERDAVMFNGKLYGLPVQGGSFMMFYRKDLINDPKEQANFKAKYGYKLQVPETWESYKDVAEFFTRPEQGLYGYGGGGKRGQGHTWFFNMWMVSHGEKMFAEDWTPRINSPTGVEFFRYYTNLFNYAAPGARGEDLDVATIHFLQGGHALLNQWPDVVPRVLDPTQCTLPNPREQVGYALLPKGEGGKHAPFTVIWASVINKYSQNKKEVWDFISWIAKRDREYLIGGGTPVRKSTLEDPKLQNIFPGLEPVSKMMPYATGFPHIIPYQEVSDALSLAINKAVAKELSPEQAANEAQKKITEIMKE